VSKNPSISASSIGLYSVPPDHPTFDENRHTFDIGVCAPAKYDGRIWRGFQRKSKGSADELEEKDLKESLGQEKCYIAFDTEYTNLREVVDQTEKDGKKNLYLSYQYSAEWKGCRWKNVGFPKDGYRIGLDEFVCWVLSECPLFKASKEDKLPHSIFLICHYSRADLPAFDEFFSQSNKAKLMNLRRTFVTEKNGAPIRFPIYFNGKKASLRLAIRDTFLLAPSTAKSLERIGEIIGKSKNAPTEYLNKMDVLRRQNLERFKEYAQSDADITLEFAEKISELSTQFGADAYLPLTLTSLGKKFLKHLWETKGFDQLAILGKEVTYVRTVDKKRKRVIPRPKIISNPFRHLFGNLAIECYHGGRNEQYFFGVGAESKWYDYDLSSAYPTAMAQLGTPIWQKARQSTDLNELIRHRLSYAHVTFKHPAGTRFPVLPVRGDDAVYFPLEGESYCCGPELQLARSLGVDVDVRLGVFVPHQDDQPFGEYLKYCIEQRNKAKRDGHDVLNQLWKELANSMYGKLAQGLRKRNVYNIAKNRSEELPECDITMPFFAAYITSFCRAVLGEILNKLPSSVSVCSCTTDGFLCTADRDQISKATSGVLSKQFLRARRYFSPSEDEILEVKSVIKQPLGWRTRGQATVLPINLIDGDSFVLAKAGLKPEARDKVIQNEWIVDKFVTRRFGETYPVRSFVSVRDMVEDQSDLYSKEMERRISMDFDWKRCPDIGTVTMREIRSKDHVFFDTKPWKNVADIEHCRSEWKLYHEQSQRCLKTVEDVRDFMDCLNHRKLLPKRQGRNNPRVGNIPAKVFKIWFARAYSNGAYGLPAKSDKKRPSYVALDKFFAERGMRGMRAALSNYRSKNVDPPNQVPKTEHIEVLVRDIKEKFPDFEVDKVFLKD
jgi:hypothetical protein